MRARAVPGNQPGGMYIETCVREGLHLSEGTRAMGIASARIHQIGPLGELTLLRPPLIRGLARHDGTLHEEMYAAVDQSQSKPWSLREERVAHLTSVHQCVRRRGATALACPPGNVGRPGERSGTDSRGGALSAASNHGHGHPAGLERRLRDTSVLATCRGVTGGLRSSKEWTRAAVVLKNGQGTQLDGSQGRLEA